LTEGFGGEALGSGDGFVGEKGKRGRDAVMRVVNNHLGFDGKPSGPFSSRRLLTLLLVTSINPTAVSPHAWEESTGLLSTLIPQASGSKINLIDPQAFNASKGELKLGPAPISEELRVETERVLREQAVLDRDPAAQYDIQITKPVIPAGLIAPTEPDLLPHPPNFKTIDIEREVSAVRDARKRIRFDPSVLNNMDLNSPQAATYRSRALPSICAYTLHDVTEGYVSYLEISVSSV
jgi:transcription initiation factor TFIID subunit 5